MRHSRRQRWLIFAVLGTLMYPASWMQADTGTEYQVKAGFLYNFSKFVTWPPETFVDARQLFNICTSGEQSWSQTFEEALKGKTVDERAVITRIVHSEKDVKGCQVLFVPAPEESKWQSLMLNARFPGMLTVTESNRLKKHERSGAVITFVLDENRVRFVIDTKAAEKAGLTISSKLLSLALEVQQ
jgi:YfiR/HmsC-like